MLERATRRSLPVLLMAILGLAGSPADLLPVAAAVEPLAALEALKNHLEQNGVVGSFKPADPRGVEIEPGKFFKRDPAVGELASGQYSDAVNGTIKNMVCFLYLFDTAANAKAFAELGDKPLAGADRKTPKRYSNGRFAVAEGAGVWPGNQKIAEALASFDAPQFAPEPATGGLASLIKYGPAYVLIALLIGLGLFIVCRPPGWPGSRDGPG